MSRRVRVDLAYDGTPFHGFARQDDVPTVQGRLEAALSRLCRAEVRTVAAGRTDAGVHAEQQVVHADVPDDWRLLDDLDRARTALDKLCGDAVTVWRVRPVPATFDARFSATQRRYRYRMCDATALSPLERHHVWHVGLPALDEAAMEAGAAHLVGEHDFASFCRQPNPADPQPLIRRVDRIRVRRRPHGRVDVDVHGRAFCHQMVRSIVACLVRVGRGRQPPEWVVQAREARDRHAVGHIAPPHGLALTGVAYPR